MRHLGTTRRVLVIAIAALGAWAAPALADAPDPIPSQTELSAPIHTNANGSFTVTVDGAWQWTTHHSDCNNDRSGVGYAIAWNDPSDPGNFVGKNGLSAQVGTTAGNTLGPDVASVLVNGKTIRLNANPMDGNLAHAAMPGNDPGLGPTTVTYNVAANGGIPTQTDANNWISSCGTFNGTFNTGTWGPISHTYPASFAGPIVICPIMYDPHQGPSGQPNGQPNQITAGGDKRNSDNSIETNGDTPLGNGCFTRTIPRVATSTKPTVPIGTAITDTATISGGNSPTGSITFQLFGPNDATCSTAIFTSNAVPVNGNGDYTSTPSFTPTALGTYRWIATYSGDSNNVKVPTGCGDSGEQVVVTKASPALTTTSSANGTIGTAVHDTAHLSGATSTAGGTITFTLFGPNDTSCANGAIFTTSTPVSGNKDYPSATFTPTHTGTYRWIASYSGDANNQAVDTDCNAANESLTITPAGPSLSTTASAAGPIGTAVGDTAHLTGATSSAGGSITFKLFGPNDANCSSGAVFTTSTAVSGDNNYPSSTFTPAHAGTYRWIASYSGDGNNKAVSTSCNDANESVAIAKLAPAVSTTASSGGGVGTAVHDTAHLSGATSSAGGTITFRLFGASDINCTQSAVFTTTTSVSGNGNYDSAAFTPATAGTYRWIASYSGDADNSPATTSCNDANESVSIAKLTPGVTTTASGNAVIGAAVSDTAHLTGGAGPTGSITFQLFGPNDTNCANGAIFTTSNTSVAGDGDYSTPSSFTPTQAGTYRWIASYSGDTNNNAVSTLCGDAGETVVISPATPSLTTTASGNGPVGTSVADTAHLGNTTSDAGGTITFNLYGPNDANCSKAVAFTTSAPVSGPGNYRSPTPDFTPSQAGTYRWIASYSGDTNNKAVTSACNAANESVTISPVGPSLTTTASGGVGVGGTVHDTAHLSGATNGATGSITFKLYGPNDSNCSQGAIFSATNNGVNGNGDYRSPTPDFDPAQAGTYRWIASYSGDPNNTATSTSCNDANESVVVSPLTPGLTTTAAGNGPIGTAVSDTAHLTGGSNPTGSITFTLFGPNDSTCSSPAVFTTTNSNVAGAGNYSTPSSFSPTQAGTYRWIATYNGDNNNGSVSTSCGDSGETVTISKVTPGLTTTASNGAAVAGIDSISDTAHLTGGLNPSGTITFSAFGPNDTNCSNAPAFQTTVSVNGNANYASTAGGSTFVPSTGGTYRWIASYSGDTHNAAVSTACNDANESTTVSPATPAIALAKAQEIAGSGAGFTHNDINGSPGQTVDYQMTVTNTGNVPLALTFTDAQCDSGTLTGPTLISGSLGANNTLSPGGKVLYTCSHLIAAADAPTFTNTANVSGQPPSGPPVTATDHVNLNVVLHPALTIVKSQRNGSSGSFTTSTISGQPGDTINYSTLVTNTGDTPLLLDFSDPKCDPGTLSGPIGGSFDGAGRLEPGSSVTFTCLHVLQASDAPSFTNVATVSGTTPQNTKVGPFSSQVTVTVQLTPGISVVKLQKIDGSGADFTANQISGAVGQKVDYEIQATNTGNEPLTLSLSDPHCDAGTISGPALVSGSLSNGVLSPGSVAAYFCSHVLAAGDAPSFTNVGTITGTPPSGPPVSGTGTVVTTLLTTGINVVKMQRISGTTAPFTTGIINATVGQTILYQMTVTNTGQVPLKLTPSDPQCDAGTLTGPVGSIDANGLLSPGGSAVYNCSHVVTAADVPQVTNVVTVTGTTPQGQGVGPATSNVTANVAQQQVAASCVAGSVALKGTVGCARKAFQAVVQAAPNSIKSVTFFLDGKKVRTLTHVGRGNRWAITIHPTQLKFGGHTLTARVTLICNGTVRTAVLHFRHCRPPAPRFTG